MARIGGSLAIQSLRESDRVRVILSDHLVLLVGAVAGDTGATQGFLLLLQRRNVLALNMLLLLKLLRFPVLMSHARVTHTGACGREAKG